MMGKGQYKEFREDGWPLCPNCGEDELYSQFSSWRNGVEVSPTPTMDDLINHGLRCYRCSFESTEIKKPYVIKVKGLDELKKALGSD